MRLAHAPEQSSVRDFGFSVPSPTTRRIYLTRPAFLSVIYAPRFFIVFRPLVETLMVIFLPSSGMKSVFFCMFTWRRRLPVGLNLVARVRLEYPPPTRDRLPVMSQIFAIRYFRPVMPAP